jgi:hypothetical protein
MQFLADRADVWRNPLTVGTEPVVGIAAQLGVDLAEHRNRRGNWPDQPLV